MHLRQDQDDEDDAVSELLFADSDYAEGDGLSRILDVDVDSVRRVAGAGSLVGTKEDSDTLVVAGRRRKKSSDGSDTLSVRVSRRDVDVVVGDGAGVLEDIDLRIEIPKDRLRREQEGTTTAPSSSVRRRIWKLMRRLGRRQKEEQEKEVVLIRDTISVRGEDGRVYDLEMDLRVEVDQEELRKQLGEEDEEGDDKAAVAPSSSKEATNGGISKSRSLGGGLNRKAGKKRSGGCLKPSRSLVFPRCPALTAPWRRSRGNHKRSSVGSSEADEDEELLGPASCLAAATGGCGSLGVVYADGGELSYADDTPRGVAAVDLRRSATDIFRFTTV